MGDPVGEGPQGLEVLQVADVVRDERPVLHRQAERVLQLRAAGQHRPGQAGGEAERLGRVAAGAAQQRFPAPQRPHHRVVGPDVDRPVVGEEGVRDARQPRQRVAVGVGDRLVGNVAAGQDDRVADLREQQVMQGSVGKHDPQLAVARRDRGGDRGAGQAVEQHHRPPGAGQQGLSGRVHLAQFPRGRQVGGHQRERLVLPVLARPQRRRRGLAARVHREVVSPQSLDRHHVPPGQQPGRLRQGVPGQFVLLAVEQAQPRPARRAADRLGVEPAVRRIVVLRRAFRAHGERGHGGQRPVVGHAGDDGEPGPTVGAVDERVAEPPVRRVRQLGQAVVTGRGVGRDQRAAAAGVVAGDDREPRRPGGGHRRRRHPVHPGHRRRLSLQQPQKLLNACCRALDLCEHAIDVVADPPGQAQPGGDGVDEGAEAHPLHDPFHADGCPDDAGHPASLPFPAPASQRPPGRAGHQMAMPGSSS